MISVDGMSSFYGKAQILTEITFSVQKGEAVSMLGRNGAGKTTTMKSIMQLVRPKSGSVKFNDVEIVGKAPHQVAKMGLGYVPEERRIFTDLTILENLEVGRRPPREGKANWTIDILFDLFPNLAERRHNRGKELSGGEQQMLTIARTLMGNPICLLLDEPSEGIAPVIVEQMAQTILRIKKQGITVVLSEQNLHFARLVADRAIIIESGQLRFDGSFKELDANPDIQEAYLSV